MLEFLENRNNYKLIAEIAPAVVATNYFEKLIKLQLSTVFNQQVKSIFLPTQKTATILNFSKCIIKPVTLNAKQTISAVDVCQFMA